MDYNPEEILMTMLILENKGNVKVDTKKYYFLSNEFLNDLEKYFKLKKKRILELIKIINSKKLR